MKKLLNTLYITNPTSYLAKEGEAIIIYQEQKKIASIPSHNIEGIVCFGYAGASPQLMCMCAEKGIGLSFVSEYGKFLCRVSGRISGNILLRKGQYRLSDQDEASAQIAKYMILGKLANQRNILKRFAREKPELCSDKYHANVKFISQMIVDLKDKTIRSTDEVRGIEGIVAKTYFENFDNLILKNKDCFYLRERTKRPPLDAMNALLSLIYTLLTHDITSALETVGLDPQAGFLHRDRPGRSSLALDLIEELRAYLCDRLALSLVNTGVLNSKDFIEKENGAVLLHPDSKSKVLKAWQTRKKDKITHPYINESIEIGLIPYVQALLLARHIRGDIDIYPSFVVK